MALSHFQARPPVALLAALGLAFVLTACASSDAPEESTAAESGSSTGTDPDEGPVDPTEPETPADETPEAPPALDHPAVLAAGFGGAAAIRCTYTYDAEELAQFPVPATGGEVISEATVYLDRGTVYWDIPQPDGRVSYVLVRDGFVYAWKVPDDAQGVQAADEEPDSLAILEDRMARNASDCVVYDGPASIFEVPSDVEFTVL